MKNPHVKDSFDWNIWETNKWCDRTEFVQKWFLIPGVILYAIAQVALVIANNHRDNAFRDLQRVQSEKKVQIPARGITVTPSGPGCTCTVVQ